MNNARLLAGSAAVVLVLLGLLLWSMQAPPEESAPASSAASGDEPIRGDRRWSRDAEGKAESVAESVVESEAEPVAEPGAEPGAEPEVSAEDRPASPSGGGGAEPVVADDDDSASDADSGDPVIHPVSPVGIDGAMRGELVGIRECYQAWLNQNPDLGGRLVVRFTIEDDPEQPGEAGVSAVAIDDDSTVDHVFIEGCVMNAVSDLRFEPPEMGSPVTVTYPFQFTAE